MNTPDVLIIGAGITGAAAALELVEMGASVEVIDRYGPAAMASGWTLAGVRQSGRHPAELPLARAAVACWQELDRRLEVNTCYRQDGNLRLARNEAEAETIRALVHDQQTAGLVLRYLSDSTALREIAPAVAPTVLAASWCPTDGHADPLATVTGYLHQAKRRGARLSMGEEVLRFEAKTGRVTNIITDHRRVSPGVVLAAPGIFINALLEPHGLSIALRRPIVTVVRTTPLPPLLRPVLGVANADMAARQEVSGRLRVTSGAENWNGALDEIDGRPVARPSTVRVMETIAKVSAVLPAFADAEVESIWGGILDLTPDALPIIDRAPGLDNLVIATGFSGHGFALGPISGLLAAELALGLEPRLALDAFRFDRFDVAREEAGLTLHG